MTVGTDPLTVIIVVFPRANMAPAGTPLSSTLRISTRHTFARSSQPSVSVISKIPASTAACFSSSPPVTRKSHQEWNRSLIFQFNPRLIHGGSFSLKPIDIVVLKKLSDVVNVVPVIAKADSLTLEERQAFKERIKEEFAFHNLKMYPYDNGELDDEERAINAQIKVRPGCYEYEK